EGADDGRRGDRRLRVEVAPIQLVEASDAQEPEAEPYLFLEELQHADETVVSRGGQPHAGDAPDPDGLRAERDALDDVRPADEAPAAPPLRPPPDGPADLG